MACLLTFNPRVVRARKLYILFNQATTDGLSVPRRGLIQHPQTDNMGAQLFVKPQLVVSFPRESSRSDVSLHRPVVLPIFKHYEVVEFTSSTHQIWRASWAEFIFSSYGHETELNPPVS